jgi:hypothetical protein
LLQQRSPVCKETNEAEVVGAPNRFRGVAAVDRTLDDAYLEGGGSLRN